MPSLHRLYSGAGSLLQGLECEKRPPVGHEERRCAAARRRHQALLVPRRDAPEGGGRPLEGPSLGEHAKADGPVRGEGVPWVRFPRLQLGRAYVAPARVAPDKQDPYAFVNDAEKASRGLGK